MGLFTGNNFRWLWGTEKTNKDFSSRHAAHIHRILGLLAFTCIIGIIIWLNYSGLLIAPSFWEGNNTQGQSNFQRQHVTIIARADESLPIPQFEAFVGSLRAQTHKTFSVWIVNGENPSKKLFPREVSQFNDNRISTLSFKFNRSVDFFHSYGYHTTDLAMRKLIANTDQNDRNEFLLVTNGDNLYNHFFLESSLKLMTNETCLVASDWISRYERNGDIFPNQVGKIAFVGGGIDLGCVVTSLFHVHRSFNKQDFFVKNHKFADYLFFEKILNKFGESCANKTNQVLFMHQ